jgi:hypothetical protein
MAGAIRGQNLDVADGGRRNRVDDPQTPAFVREMVTPINDVGRVLNRSVDRVVLDFRQRLVRQTNLRRRFVTELELSDFSARSNQPALHHGQLISQIDGPAVVIEHVFAVLLCVATACQVGGGPTSAVAATVTSIKVNPFLNCRIAPQQKRLESANTWTPSLFAQALASLLSISSLYART